MAHSLDTDVAVIGAGPYGLSIAAHLSGRGVEHQIFGTLMDTWRNHMPHGMYLKSEGFATNLSEPGGGHTLEQFCAESGVEYGRTGVPISSDTFTRYGHWFQERLVPDLDARHVVALRSSTDGFELELDDGNGLQAGQVVVATGLQGHAYVPRVLTTLPNHSVVHTYDHVDPSEFPESGVAVVGAGQSALEAAALLRERGATVHVVARAPQLAWLSKPGGRDRPLIEKWRYPESGLGEGRAQWAYANHPLTFHAGPRSWRLEKAFSVLGPAGAWWLRPRIDSCVDVRLGRRLIEARTVDGLVRLRLESDSGSEELEAGQVVAGTGYRLNLDSIPFLDGGLRAGFDAVGGGPALDRSFESSVPGLYFAGFPAAPSFGPLMRFVFGADFTARRITRRIVR